jgi:hypothetical protein
MSMPADHARTATHTDDVELARLDADTYALSLGDATIHLDSTALGDLRALLDCAPGSIAQAVHVDREHQETLNPVFEALLLTQVWRSDSAGSAARLTLTIETLNGAVASTLDRSDAVRLIRTALHDYDGGAA